MILIECIVRFKASSNWGYTFAVVKVKASSTRDKVVLKFRLYKTMFT